MENSERSWNYSRGITKALRDYEICLLNKDLLSLSFSSLANETYFDLRKDS